MPRKVFVANEILTAADVNEYLGDQAVMVFEDFAALDAGIPSPVEGMVCYLKNIKKLFVYNGFNWQRFLPAFNRRQVITATNLSWPVPSAPPLIYPLVRVTVIGAGGGGSGGVGSGGSMSATAGGTGGTSSFKAPFFINPPTISAAGGEGGALAVVGNQTGRTGTAGFSAGNGGQGGATFDNNDARGPGISGNGGAVSVAYVDVRELDTCEIVIGAGGAGGQSGRNGAGFGGAGGRGEVIIEYAQYELPFI
jgi:hypothetical protein